LRRGTKIAIGILVALAVLLAINTVVVDSQTKSAEPTIDGGRILEVPAGAVQVLEEGPADAQPVVLIHCDACSLHWWDRLAPLLAENHRVIRIDLLGFGGSEKPSSGYSIDEQANAVAAALDQLRVQGAVVVGHSMGFSVATALAERASQLVDRLVNLGEGPNPDACELPFLARLGYVPVIGEAIWRLTPDFQVKNGYEEAFAPGFDLEEGFPNPDQVLEDYDSMTYTSYGDAKDANEDFQEEISLPDRLRPLAIPLLAIFGSEDQVCDPAQFQDAYATVPGARVEELDGAGHSPNVELPEETAALIEEFAGTVPVEPKGGGDRSGEASRSERGERGR
jgi:pimeloyl-ACP methyl ester carboxylesterase